MSAEVDAADLRAAADALGIERDPATAADDDNAVDRARGAENAATVEVPLPRAYREVLESMVDRNAFVDLAHAVRTALRELLPVDPDGLTDRRLAEFSHHHRAVYAVLEEADGAIQMGDLYEAYHARVEDPRSDRSVRRYLDELREVELIVAEGSTGGRHYRLPEDAREDEEEGIDRLRDPAPEVRDAGSGDPPEIGPAPVEDEAATDDGEPSGATDAEVAAAIAEVGEPATATDGGTPRGATDAEVAAAIPETGEGQTGESPDSGNGNQRGSFREEPEPTDRNSTSGVPSAVGNLRRGETMQIHHSGIADRQIDRTVQDNLFTLDYKVDKPIVRPQPNRLKTRSTCCRGDWSTG